VSKAVEQAGAPTPAEPELGELSAIIKTGLAEAADTLKELRELLDNDNALPRRTLALALEGAERRVDATLNALDRHDLAFRRPKPMAETQV